MKTLFFILFFLTSSLCADLLGIQETTALDSISSLSPLLDWDITNIQSCNLGDRVTCSNDGGTFHVIELDLTNLEFTQIPMTLNDLRKLKNLDLSGNSIGAVTEESFKGLEELEVLNLSSCGTVTFEVDSFLKLISLSRLVLDGTHIVDFFENNLLDPLVNLATLRLHSTMITEIPDYAFANLNKLTGLYLGNNNLKYGLSTHSFNGLDILATLDMSNININSFPIDLFSPLGQLAMLFMNDNDLSNAITENTFQGLVNVVRMQLRNTKLEELPNSVMHHLSNLITLHVGQNYLEKLILPSLLNLGQVTITENNFISLDNIDIAGGFDSLDGNCFSSCGFFEASEGMVCGDISMNPFIRLSCDSTCHDISYNIPLKCMERLYPDTAFTCGEPGCSLDVTNTYTMDSYALYVVVPTIIPPNTSIYSSMKHWKGNIFVEGSFPLELGSNVVFTLRLLEDDMDLFISHWIVNNMYTIAHDTQGVNDYKTLIYASVLLSNGLSVRVPIDKSGMDYGISRESIQVQSMLNYFHLVNCNWDTSICDLREQEVWIHESISMFYDTVITNVTMKTSFHQSGGLIGAQSNTQLKLESILFELHISTEDEFSQFCAHILEIGRYIIVQSFNIDGAIEFAIVHTPYGVFNPQVFTNTSQSYFTLSNGLQLQCSLKGCTGGSCTVEEDSMVDNEEVILPNNTVIIKGSSTTIRNSTLVITNPSESRTPIIVDSGSIVIENTTLIFNIEDKDIINAIKDGDQILIKETINGGTIEGSFENVELVIPTDREDCRNISAKIE